MYKIDPEKEKSCPICGSKWRKDENIYETFIQQGVDALTAAEWASWHGHTEEDPHYFGTEAFMGQVEDDRLSAWHCVGCGSSWGISGTFKSGPTRPLEGA